jgi:hypothetical protein
MGTGDSDGEFEDATVETRVSNIVKAVGILKERAKIQRIGLLGMRLGATWAALAAAESIKVNSLILWDPIMNVKEFLDNSLRRSVAFQSVLFGEILFDRKKLIERLISDGKIEHQGYQLNIVDGCPISRDFYIQSMYMDLPARLKIYPGNVLIIQIDRANEPLTSELIDLTDIRSCKGKAVDLVHVNESMRWWTIGGSNRVPEPDRVFDVTENWIANHLS